MRHRYLSIERTHGEDTQPDAGDLADGCARRVARPAADEAELLHLLVPLPSQELEAYEVSMLVNSPKNDFAGLCAF